MRNVSEELISSICKELLQVGEENNENSHTSGYSRWIVYWVEI